jgi:pilus assembly protein CpaE
MQVLIVSDHEPTTARVRQALLRHGLDCPAGRVVSLSLAVDHLAAAPAQLVVVVLAPDPEHALAVLDGLRPAAPCRVVVVGPASDTRLVIRALRGGAGDYINEAELETELGAALERLRAERSAQKELGRTIAVLAPSGGSGSSTLAVNVATALAREHQRSLLVDLKLETGDLAALLDLKPTHTLADLCQNAARMDRVMFERSLARHASGVHLLAPPRTFADIPLVTPEGIRLALALARALFPYVVADLDHSFREEQAQVLRQADVILVVMRLDFTCLRHTQRALDYLAALGAERDRVRVVVNRYGQPKEVPAAKAEEALGVKFFHYVPDDPKTVNRANNSGVPVILESPSAKVSRSVAQLAGSINGRHPKP